MYRLFAALLCGAMIAPSALAAPALAVPVALSRPAMTVERVVMLMRHGVRPPTKSPPMPAGIAADPWPTWPVAPGWLTPHGAAAIRLAGTADRSMLTAQGVLPARGCPAEGAVAMMSDSDQRTIATGDAYLAGLVPGCTIANRHKPQDVADPLFSPISDNATTFDAARANAAIAETLGPAGIAGAERRQRAALAAIDRITCGTQKTNCGVTYDPSGLKPAEPGRRPKLTGTLDRGSTVAQILLLEYADGKPMSEVGWGRASAADIALVGELHSSEFAILARPRYLAQANISGIAALMLKALSEPGPRVSLIVGHDTNVAALAGLLGVHWRIAGFAPDDPAPGGALGLELLRDQHGRRWVRAFYRAQSLDQIRTLAGGRLHRIDLPIEECSATPAGLCPLDAFVSRMTDRH